MFREHNTPRDPKWSWNQTPPNALLRKYEYICLITSSVVTLVRLDDFGGAHLKLGTKHAVPEAACDTETVLVVFEVVLEVVLLQLLVVLREPWRS
jgi:hypothetical protein